MPAPQKRLKDMTPEERREYHAAEQRRYRERKRAEKEQQQRQAGQFTTPKKSPAKAPQTPIAQPLTDTDPATMAAVINSRFGYSEIIAYHRFKNRVTICEKMKLYEDGKPYRIKVTTYESFSSKADAVTWMREHGCKKLQEC